MEYKKTLNLPQTDFPIRAKLAEIEAEMTAFWAKQDVYHQMGKRFDLRNSKADSR